MVANERSGGGSARKDEQAFGTQGRASDEHPPSHASSRTNSGPQEFDQNGEPITPLDRVLFDHYVRERDFLVPQLRNLAHLNPHAIEVVEKAADRLERYEKALRDIVALDYRGNQPNEQRIAAEALRGRP